MSISTVRYLERLTRELHALTEVAKTLTAPLDLPALLDAVMTKLTNVLEPVEIGAIMLWDASSGLFRAEATFGYDLEILREMGLRAGESITGKVYDEGEDDVRRGSGYAGLVSGVFAPPFKVWQRA